MTALLLALATSLPALASDADAADPGAALEADAPDATGAPQPNGGDDAAPPADDDEEALDGAPPADGSPASPDDAPTVALDGSDPLGEIIIPAPVHGWPRTADGIASALQELMPRLEECIAMVEEEDPASDTGETDIQISLRLQFEMTPPGMPGPIQLVEGDDLPALSCITGAMSTLRFEAGPESRQVQVPVRMHITR